MQRLYDFSEERSTGRIRQLLPRTSINAGGSIPPATGEVSTNRERGHSIYDGVVREGMASGLVPVGRNGPRSIVSRADPGTHQHSMVCPRMSPRRRSHQRGKSPIPLVFRKVLSMQRHWAKAVACRTRRMSCQWQFGSIYCELLERVTRSLRIFWLCGATRSLCRWSAIHSDGLARNNFLSSDTSR